jgi:hypothetical protein
VQTAIANFEEYIVVQEPWYQATKLAFGILCARDSSFARRVKHHVHHMTPLVMHCWLLHGTSHINVLLHW